MKTLIFNNKGMNLKSREPPLVWGEGKELEKQGRWEVEGMMSGSGILICMDVKWQVEGQVDTATAGGMTGPRRERNIRNQRE